jgi:hypothetical protein
MAMGQAETYLTGLALNAISTSKGDMQRFAWKLLMLAAEHVGKERKPQRRSYG